MAYADYVAELVGTVPRMSALHAGQVLNRAWRRVRDGRLWSFQFVTGAQLFCPNAIVGGSVSATFGSNLIIADREPLREQRHLRRILNAGDLTLAEVEQGLRLGRVMAVTVDDH